MGANLTYTKRKYNIKTRDTGKELWEVPKRKPKF